MFIEQQIALRKLATVQRANISAKFFKTGPGQYGEGDQFIGVTVPETRIIAKKYRKSPQNDLLHLLKSKIHEDRLLALLILTEQFKKTKNLKIQRRIVSFLIRNRVRINNWDLVDLSAPCIIGHYCYLIDDDSVLRKLASSKRHWDKRLAMVGTLAFIRQGKTDLCFEFAKLFLNETEDLMHKATGWMLREAGKKNLKALKIFITLHGKKMPRTMLRYSIEKFTELERKKILAKTR